jgi:hypothetical protein
VFWTISAFQLLLLMKTLPQDQDAMEAELASYAAQAISSHAAATAAAQREQKRDDDDSQLLVTTIAERMISFDDIAAEETLAYVRAGIQELGGPFLCNINTESSSSRSSDDDDDDDDAGNESLDDAARLRQNMWLFQEQQAMPHTTPTAGEDANNHLRWTDETLLQLPPRTTEQYRPSEVTPLLV